MRSERRCQRLAEEQAGLTTQGLTSVSRNSRSAVRVASTQRLTTFHKASSHCCCTRRQHSFRMLASSNAIWLDVAFGRMTVTRTYAATPQGYLGARSGWRTTVGGSMKIVMGQSPPLMPSAAQGAPYPDGRVLAGLGPQRGPGDPMHRDRTGSVAKGAGFVRETRHRRLAESRGPSRPGSSGCERPSGFSGHEHQSPTGHDPATV
jgi:hypothetical protein